jgi:hypothetical protein
MLKELVIEKVKSFASYKEAADFFGVTPAIISGWVTGKREPTLKAAELCAGDLVKAADVESVGETKVPWQGRDLMVLMPSGRTTTPETMYSLLASFDRTTMQYNLQVGMTHIQARNVLATRFLESGCQWSLWVDDDMAWPCGNPKWFKNITGRHDLSDRWAGMNAIHRLVSHQKTIIGGLYFGRVAPYTAQYAAAFADSAESQMAKQGPFDKIKPTDWVATGFLLVHRSVYLDILDKNPSLRSPNTKSKPHAFFTPTGASNSLQGEDVAFCERARYAGHQPYVDLGCLVAHRGDSWITR